MRTQISQTATRRQFSSDRVGAWTREQHLAAVAGRQQPRYAVDRRSEIVAVALVGRTYMECGAYSQPVDCRKILGGNSALGTEYRHDGVFGMREGCAKRIAHRFENVASVSSDRRSHQRVVSTDGILHRLAIAFPTNGAAFDVGESERNRAGRASPGRWPRPCLRRYAPRQCNALRSAHCEMAPQVPSCGSLPSRETDPSKSAESTPTRSSRPHFTALTRTRSHPRLPPQKRSCRRVCP